MLHIRVGIVKEVSISTHITASTQCINVRILIWTLQQTTSAWNSLICSAKFCSINLMFSDTYRWFSVLINIDGVVVLLKASSSSSIGRHVYFVLCVNWYLYGLIVVGYICFYANRWAVIQPVYVQHLVLYRKIRTGICKRIMVEITSKTFVQSFRRKY